MDNWIFKYHEAIQKKEVIVGVWVRLCFEILTTGLLNGEWEFNEKKANKAIKFIENFCHHSEGRSDLLHLELWQKAIVSAIFGIMDKTTGYRQFREVFIIVARKNGKTLFAAAIAAYMTYVDGEYGAKVYFLAPKLDQADLVYDAFYQIVQSDDELDSITKKRRSDIYIKAFNTSVKKIAFNSKKSDGFNPQLVVNDEMEAWPGDQGLKQYEVMTSALGARKQPLIISIATAGYVNDGIFDELFKRATAFLKGNSREKRLLPFIYMIDDIENDIVGAIADAIGKNVGKLKPQVIRKDEKGMVIKNDYLARLLSLRPCPEMSTYDFLYRIAVDLVYTSNSFSVIFWNKDFTRVESIQPITTTSYRIFEDDKNNILFRFRWDYDGKMYTVPYQNVIHVKARYNKRRFLGTTPDMELKRSLDLIETSGETIKNIVNRSNSLAGYLKYNNIADDEELKEIARNFQDAYMNKDNAGGIAAIDNTVEFKEISQRTPSIPTNQITFLRDNIYRYYGVNDKILTSTLNDTEFISFYENVIEPISVQLSYEFTFKLLTPREIGYGNRIDFVANLLQYATLQTRETIGGGMFDRGALTINEYRELMYYGPVEDGDQRLVSLNYVKVGDQSLYQVGQQNEPPDDTGANDREKRAMQAAARAYMQIMKGG